MTNVKLSAFNYIGYSQHGIAHILHKHNPSLLCEMMYQTLQQGMKGGLCLSMSALASFYFWIIDFNSTYKYLETGQGTCNNFTMKSTVLGPNDSKSFVDAHNQRGTTCGTREWQGGKLTNRLFFQQPALVSDYTKPLFESCTIQVIFWCHLWFF